MQDIVVMTNLKGEVIICSREEAEAIQAKQMVEIINNSFTSNRPKEPSQ